MSRTIESVRLSFRFGGVDVPYLETEQQGAYRRQAYNLKSKRLGQIERTSLDWLKDDEESELIKDPKVKNSETSDVTASNIIMPLPKYKADLDKLNCYLYQTTFRNNYGDSKRHSSSVQKLNLDQIEDLRVKRKLHNLRPLRYGSQTHLWQQIPNSAWDRTQIREPFTNEPNVLPNAKKQAFRNPICRKTVYPGEWAEPGRELIDSILNNTLSDIMKLPYPGYTGKKRCVDNNCGQSKENPPDSYLYKSSTKLSHRKFPDYEYNPSHLGRKSTFSKTIDPHNQSPFGNTYPPVRTGTWINYLYQPRWS
uniref:Uncharacterized protein n=1 Tax=Strigamia maritima TaxID=126957 RepID=T1ISB0_STRMM